MVNFRIALINVFWSEDDINNRYFETIEEQNSYFDNLTAGKFSPLLNFNMGNNIKTTIIYRDTSGREGDELNRCNYAVVQKINGENIISRRYFFAYPTQDAQGQMIVDLSLDDIQTNYFKYKQTIAPCLIRRANLNRWVDNGDGSVSFDARPESKLFSAEPVSETGKRLIKRTNLFLQPDTNSEGVLNQWLKENVVGWEYYYFMPNHTYNYLVFGTNDPASNTFKPMKTYSKDLVAPTTLLQSDYDQINKINGSLVVMCVPIYNKTSSGFENMIKIVNRQNANNYIMISQLGIEEFLNLNDNTSFLYARKFSLLPPFQLFESDSDITIDNKNNLVIQSTSFSTRTYIHGNYGLNFIHTGNSSGNTIPPTTIPDGIINVIWQQGEMLSEFYETEKQLTFQKNEIIDAPKDVKFNPKLLNNQFFEIRVCQGPQNFAYDLQKMAKERFRLKYAEALTPDITKGYARIDNLNGIYINECGENFTGLVLSNDQSLMVANDQLSNMLANNKNFFLQQIANMGQSILSGTLSGGIVGAGKAVLNGGFQAIDVGLTLDNMRSAPAQIKNANGNVYFTSIVQKFNLAIEEYDILETEKQSLNDLMTQFGFLYNKIDNISNFDNIRYYYNYIEADVDVITAPISNEEKQRLRDTLKSIRFWNSDNIQYELENYERGLLDE